MNKSIGEKLKQLRKSRNLTLDEIIKELNISESTYLRMEKGKLQLGQQKLIKFAKCIILNPKN